jgi:hypothetical protein
MNTWNIFLVFVLYLPQIECVACPEPKKYGKAPSNECKGKKPMDPNLKAKTFLERWFTKEMFDVSFFRFI